MTGIVRCPVLIFRPGFELSSKVFDAKYTVSPSTTLFMTCKERHNLCSCILGSWIVGLWGQPKNARVILWVHSACCVSIIMMLCLEIAKKTGPMLAHLWIYLNCPFFNLITLNDTGGVGIMKENTIYILQTLKQLHVESY